MSQCIERGLENVGVLPGGLGVSRRAAKLYQALLGKTSHAEHESLFDWLNVYAMAVNEENAAGGRVVTAPTNGAAGIIPAVIRRYCVSVTAVDTDAVRCFLLTAAEIGMEHNLGLTCDPVGGLVQIPCIERNAMGAVKAVNAARLALTAADSHKVKLDQVIETMRQTGLDMSRKYKETSEGGLAVNVIEC
jgi:L-serine dehydratase